MGVPGNLRVSWEPRKQFESKGKGCGPWSRCLILPSSRFPWDYDSGTEGVLLLRVGNWRIMLGICYCCGFKYTLSSPQTWNSRNNRRPLAGLSAL